MMESLLSRNSYIKHFNSLYSLYNKDHRLNVIKEDGYEKYGLFNRLKKPIYKESLDTQSIEFDQKVNLFADEKFKPSAKYDDYTNIIRTFSDMFEFSQFVRYAEKTIFYVNDVASPLFVDSDMNSFTQQQFAIFNPDYLIKFNLEKKIDEVNSIELEVITIEVERQYGKKMTNKFTIVNREVKYNDIADSLLIDTINTLLYDAMYNTYINIMKKLKEHFEGRIIWDDKTC